MTFESVLIICVAVMFVSSCILFFSIKRISANIYIKTIQEQNGVKSPYGYVRARNSENGYGYAMTKNDKIIMIPNTNGYEVYSRLGDLITEINRFEKIEGYRLTTLD